MAVPADPSAFRASFLDAVRAELEGRDDPFAILALQLAEDYANPVHAPSARRTFASEFVKAYKQARGTNQGAPADELRRRRTASRRGTRR